MSCFWDKTSTFALSSKICATYKTVTTFRLHPAAGRETMVPMLSMSNGVKVSAKWSRCVEFVLPDGKVIVCKVQGEKPVAAADAKALVAALVA